LSIAFTACFSGVAVCLVIVAPFLCCRSTRFVGIPFLFWRSARSVRVVETPICGMAIGLVDVAPQFRFKGLLSFPFLGERLPGCASWRWCPGLLRLPVSPVILASGSINPLPLPFGATFLAVFPFTKLGLVRRGFSFGRCWGCDFHSYFIVDFLS
jgi:hypothetical protein